MPRIHDERSASEQEPRLLDPARAARLALAVAVLAACSREGSVVVGGGSRPADGIAYDFAANLDYARHWSELQRLVPAAFETRHYLTRGWAYPPPPREDGRPATQHLWSDARRAELELYLPRPEALTLSSAALALVAPGETNRMRLSLNGTELAAFELGDKWSKLRLELPVEEQLPGINSLTFDFEHARTRKEVLGESPSGLRFSARFQPFELIRREAAATERIRWGEQRVSGGVARRELPGGSLAVEQLSTALLRYHVEVPRGARLRTRGLLVDAQGRPGAAARLRLELTAPGAEPVALWEQSLELGQTADVDVPLNAYAGAPARLDFRVVAADASRAVVAAWIDPLLHVQEAAAAAPAAEPEPSACERELEQRLAQAPVVAILIDACNRDFISSYGGRPGLTPNIDRLAAEGTLFERAHSVACYTVASIGSMFSDRYSWEHGTWIDTRELPPEFPTWPERFRAAGYRTVGIIHSINGSSQLGFGRGFEELREVFRTRKDQQGVALAEEALPHLEQVLAADDGRPLFLWIHLIEPHRPYTPPEPWAGSRSAELAGEADGSHRLANLIKNREVELDQAGLARLRALYEENLAYVDDVLGRLRERLEVAGVFDRAVVVLFSDHGEGFLEHEGKFQPGIGHGPTTYDEMNQIPLVFRLPSGLGRGGRRTRALAAGIDLLPTLGDLVGVQGPSGGRGQSLARLFCEPAAGGREHMLSHSFCSREERFLPMWAHWWRDYKLVYQTGFGAELYDTASDPGETRDLAALEPVIAGYLRQKLGELAGLDLDQGQISLEHVTAGELDAQALEELRALGYAR